MIFPRALLWSGAQSKPFSPPQIVVPLTAYSHCGSMRNVLVTKAVFHFFPTRGLSDAPLLGWAWYRMSRILMLGSLKQQNDDFKVSLDNIVRLCLKERGKGEGKGRWRRREREGGRKGEEILYTNTPCLGALACMYPAEVTGRFCLSSFCPHLFPLVTYQVALLASFAVQ